MKKTEPREGPLLSATYSGQEALFIIVCLLYSQVWLRINLLFSKYYTIYLTLISTFCAELEREKIYKAMRHWENHTCVRFQVRRNQVNYMNIIKSSG